jgi:hypothetical protein
VRRSVGATPWPPRPTLDVLDLQLKVRDAEKDRIGVLNTATK